MKDDVPNDKFKKYNSAWESYRDHSLLLMRSHYKHLQFLSKTDYAGWAKGLEKAGYATDKQYAEKLTAIIENLQLYRFDEAWKIYILWKNLFIKIKEINFAA